MQHKDTKTSLSFTEIEESVRQNPVLDDVADSRDYVLDDLIAGAPELPASFSLRKRMTPVRNQGKRGACVGFAATAVSEFFNAEEFKNKNLNLSEEYLFKRIKEIDLADYNYAGYGAHYRSGAKALAKFGTCLEKTAPYNFDGAETAWKNFIPTAAMDIEAAQYRADSYLQAYRSKEGIKRALSVTQAPLLGGVKLYKSYRKAKTNGGLVPIPQPGEEYVGGHAMAIVGYTDKYIEFKNSWGDGWGDDGYLWWPWEAIDYVSTSIWSFTDLISNPLISTEKAMEFNKQFLLDHQKEAWEEMIRHGGIINEGTKPDAPLTKGDFMVFCKRMKDSGYFR